MAGYTPLLKANNLGKRLGLNNLYIKNDSVNPSFSFKDRVVSVAATKAVEFGYETLACASTGNLACSVAAHAARAGVDAVVFIPADLERGKVIGAAVYNPTLVAVEGTYDEVNRLCSEVSDNYHWAFVNINMRPYYAEGSKTLGYEVAEQLGWRVPDHVVVPSASGAMFTKIWKGFNELACLGLLDGVSPMPFGADQNTVHHPAVTTRMHMAQAAGCCPIVSAWENQQNQIRPVRPDSIAKSLAIGNPADGIYALRVIRESDGSGYAVPESQVVNGIKLLAETEGIFTETAGGVTVSHSQIPRGDRCNWPRRIDRGLHYRQWPEDPGSGRRSGEPIAGQTDDGFLRGGSGKPHGGAGVDGHGQAAGAVHVLG